MADLGADLLAALREQVLTTPGGPGPPGPDDDLFGWGLDSLRVVELWDRACEAAGIEIDLDAFLRTPTLGSLVALAQPTAPPGTAAASADPTGFVPSYKQEFTARRLAAQGHTPASPLGITMWLPPDTADAPVERLHCAFAEAWRSQSILRLSVSDSGSLTVLPQDSPSPYLVRDEVAAVDARAAGVSARGFAWGGPLVVAVAHSHWRSIHLTVLVDHLVTDRLGMLELGRLLRRILLDKNEARLEDTSLLAHRSVLERERRALARPIPELLGEIVAKVGVRPRFPLAPAYSEASDELAVRRATRDLPAGAVSRWRQVARDWSVSLNTLLLTAVSWLGRDARPELGVCAQFANRFGISERTSVGWFATRLPLDLSWATRRSAADQAARLQRQVTELTTSSSALPYPYLVRTYGAQTSGPTLVVQVYEPLAGAAAPYLAEVEEPLDRLRDVHLNLVLYANGSARLEITHSSAELTDFLDGLARLMTSDVRRWGQ